jgi:hypothetical protein
VRTASIVWYHILFRKASIIFKKRPQMLKKISQIIQKQAKQAKSTANGDALFKT